MYTHFFVVVFFFFFFFHISCLEEILQFPCKPPLHNSYPFCNTSLPIAARAQSLISLLSLHEKIQRLSDNTTQIPRLGIPAYEWWSESLHGIATNGPGITFDGPIRSATSFPQVILTAASFNRSLWQSIASAIASEARAMFNAGQAGLTFWAPNINIFRDPRWGRGQETPGEDPMVASAFAVEYVRGFQQGGYGGGSKIRFGEKRALLNDDSGGDGLMLSACCKHLTAYDLEKWGNFSRYSFNAVVTEQDMADTFEPPFRSCIEQGKASCLMCSYNQVNGVPACARQDLLQKARTQWGFQGYITSDCDAIATIYEYQNYTKTPEDAVAIALKAGTDINCGTYMLRHTLSAIKHGKVQEEDIDRALFNLFTVQLRLGLFDGDPKNGRFGKLGAKDVCTSKNRALALEAAKQGTVLLKNQQRFLPLNKKSVSSIAVIGPLANDTKKMGGGYTGIPCNPKSIFEGIKDYVKRASYAAGCEDVSCNSTSGFVEALSLVGESEFVILVAGLDLSQETEDQDRYSLLLPGYQMALITAIAAVSKNPPVLVLTGGGPVDVSFAEINPQIPSILWIGYPGETGGKAVAEIIFGDYNPGGRLPMTWYPESFTSVPMNDMNMRADSSRGYPGRTYRFYTGGRVYGFGHGLSYTNFAHKLLYAPTELSLLGSIMSESEKNIRQRRSVGIDYIEIDEVGSCDSLRFSVRISVTNTGEIDGSRVVLLFSRLPRVSIGAPIKQLVGFNRVDRVSGRTTVETSIMVDPCEHLSTANEKGKRVFFLGEHTLMVEDLEHIVWIKL